jgi:hypothetical protein
VTIKAVSEMVVTTPWSLLALRLADSPRGLGNPIAIGAGTVGLIVGLQLSIRGSIAEVLGLDVLALLLVVVAVVLVVGEDNDVLPWGGVPVGVVVTFLCALEPEAVSVGVLASVHGRGTGLLSSNPEALVAVTSGAHEVVLIGFVHSVLELAVEVALNVIQSLVVIVRRSGVGVGGDGVCGGTVTDDLSLVRAFTVIRAHVLQDEVALGVGVTAGVLSGPFNSKDGSFVVGQRRTPAIPSTGIVL